MKNKGWLRAEPKVHTTQQGAHKIILKKQVHDPNQAADNTGST